MNVANIPSEAWRHDDLRRFEVHSIRRLEDGSWEVRVANKHAHVLGVYRYTGRPWAWKVEREEGPLRYTSISEPIVAFLNGAVGLYATYNYERSP